MYEDYEDYMDNEDQGDVVGLEDHKDYKDHGEKRHKDIRVCHRDKETINPFLLIIILYILLTILNRRD